MKRSLGLIAAGLLALTSISEAGPVPPFVSLFWRGVLDDADQATAQTSLGLGTGDSPTWTGATLSGDTFILATSKTPADAFAAGTTGQIAWDADYLYVCVAANTWKRVAIATWGGVEHVIYAGENVVFAAEQVVYP